MHLLCISPYAPHIRGLVCSTDCMLVLPGGAYFITVPYSIGWRKNIVQKRSHSSFVSVDTCGCLCELETGPGLCIQFLALFCHHYH